MTRSELPLTNDPVSTHRRGHFAFETRNPNSRVGALDPQRPIDRTGPGGVVIQYSRAVEAPVKRDLVHFTQTYSHPSWDGPKESSSTLRFLGADALPLLTGAGLVIEEQFGDWDPQPLTDASSENHHHRQAKSGVLRSFGIHRPLHLTRAQDQSTESTSRRRPAAPRGSRRSVIASGTSTRRTLAAWSNNRGFQW